MSSVIAPPIPLFQDLLRVIGETHRRMLICRSTQSENWSFKWTWSKTWVVHPAEEIWDYLTVTARQSLTTDQAQNHLTYKYSLGVLVLDYLIGAFLPVITSMRKGLNYPETPLPMWNSKVPIQPIQKPAITDGRWSKYLRSDFPRGLAVALQCTVWAFRQPIPVPQLSTLDQVNLLKYRTSINRVQKWSVWSVKVK